MTKAKLCIKLFDKIERSAKVAKSNMEQTKYRDYERLKSVLARLEWQLTYIATELGKSDPLI